MNIDIDKEMHPIVAWSLVAAISIGVLLLMFAQVGQDRRLSGEKTVKQMGIFSGKEEAVVAIDFGDGNIRRFKGPLSQDDRAWDLFQQAIAIGGISVETSDHFVPEVIDGYKNQENGKKWNFYLNGVKQKSKPFEIRINPGDEAIFKYE